MLDRALRLNTGSAKPQHKGLRCIALRCSTMPLLHDTAHLTVSCTVTWHMHYSMRHSVQVCTDQNAKCPVWSCDTCHVNTAVVRTACIQAHVWRSPGAASRARPAPCQRSQRPSSDGHVHSNKSHPTCDGSDVCSRPVTVYVTLSPCTVALKCIDT
jgi:hypothetical protein